MLLQHHMLEITHVLLLIKLEMFLHQLYWLLRVCAVYLHSLWFFSVLLFFFVKFILHFLELPLILPLSLSTESSNEGDYVQLTCIITKGDLPLKFDWFLENNLITNSLATTLNVGRQTSLLIIQSVTSRHSGNYTCTATNSAGSSSQSAKLAIKGRYKNCLNFFCWFAFFIVLVKYSEVLRWKMHRKFPCSILLFSLKLIIFRLVQIFLLRWNENNSGYPFLSYPFFIEWFIVEWD